MDENLSNATAIRIPFAQTDPLLRALLPKLVRFQQLLRDHGGHVEIDSKASRAAWLMLPEEGKMAAFKGFSAYLNNCEDIVRAGISLRDNYGVLMHSLRKAHLFTTEEVNSVLTNENIVEVYNLDHVQLFRSINFFDLCNYSLLDLVTRQWFELFDRLSSDTEANLREFQMALDTGKMRRLTVAAHLLKERDSNPRGVFLYDPQYCCPVYSAPGLLGGYLLTANVTEIELFAPGEESIAFLK